jgi:Flp pilus assembly protein TadG
MGTLHSARIKAPKTRCRWARRGVAAVEFALVAPIFVAFAMGFVEFGRALAVQQMLTNASRAGARVAAKDSTVSVSDVQSAVGSYLSGARISGATTTVSPASLAGVQDGEPVTVVVSIPFQQVSWLPSPWLLGDARLQASSVMTRQP